jgi:hypothetical protein
VTLDHQFLGVLWIIVTNHVEFTQGIPRSPNFIFYFLVVDRRLTSSYRTVYAEVIEELQKELRGCFVDLQHKAAFDLLYKEAWRPEEAAMGNSTLPTVLDKLCMVANINTRKLIDVIKAEIKLKETKIEELAQMIDSLEQKIKDQSGHLDILEANCGVRL